MKHLTIIAWLIFSPIDDAKIRVIETTSAECSILLAVFWYKTANQRLLLHTPKCYSLVVVEGEL